MRTLRCASGAATSAAAVRPARRATMAARAPPPAAAAPRLRAPALASRRCVAAAMPPVCAHSIGVLHDEDSDDEDTPAAKCVADTPAGASAAARDSRITVPRPRSSSHAPPPPPGCRWRRVMLKISGEALAGEAGFGIDADLVLKFAKEVAAMALEGVQARPSRAHALKHALGRRSGAAVATLLFGRAAHAQRAPPSWLAVLGARLARPSAPRFKCALGCRVFAPGRLPPHADAALLLCPLLRRLLSLSAAETSSAARSVRARAWTARPRTTWGASLAPRVSKARRSPNHLERKRRPRPLRQLASLMPLLTPARSMLATVMNALQLQAALESVGVPVRVQTVRPK